MSKNNRNKVYAYCISETGEQGIVSTWAECEKNVKGVKARYKSFPDEKAAKEWLEGGAEYEPKARKLEGDFSELDRNAVYFDAGTGRGHGVEVRITDYDGNSLLYRIMDKSKINEYGNYYVAQNRTNNFGELTALFMALKYAEKYNIMTICGDSSLVIEYWSKGRYGADLEEDTVALINRTSVLRKEFERKNGKIKKISGDVNPADLGFHK